jgi:hypothetical protein
LDDDAQAMMKFLQSSHDYVNDYLMWYDGAMLHIHRIESGGKSSHVHGTCLLICAKSLQLVSNTEGAADRRGRADGHA